MTASRLEALTHKSRPEKVFLGPGCFCASAQRQSDGNFRTERKPSYSSLAKEKLLCLFELEHGAKTCYNAVNQQCQGVQL